ncbi:MAG: hypothetical protein GPJ52_11840 [Candidatus Heimdallarchaeota archaeon]|nr:hypothetical protein [Candidatus Heimdallarchaeota archaeon]
MSGGKDKNCAHCRSVVQHNEAFCNNCGLSLEEIDEPIIQVQQSPNIYNNLAIAALFIGILSIVTNFFPLLSIICITASIVGIITGIIGIVKSQKIGLAFVGLAMGIISVVFWTLVRIGIFDLPSFSDFWI